MLSTYLISAMASSQVSQIAQLVHPQTHCDSVKYQQIENFRKYHRNGSICIITDKREKEKGGWGIMPCPHKGDKTLAAHSQHLEIPCQDFPADFKKKVLLGRWYSCFREVRCLKTQLEESELNIYRMINSLKHTKHENS